MSPRFIEVHGVPSTPETLRDLPCITFDAPFSASRWRFQTADQQPVEVTVDTRLSVNVAEAALDAAIRDRRRRWICCRYQVSEAVQAGRLVPILESWEVPPTPVHLVHAGRWPAAAQDAAVSGPRSAEVPHNPGDHTVGDASSMKPSLDRCPLSRDDEARHNAHWDAAQSCRQAFEPSFLKTFRQHVVRF